MILPFDPAQGERGVLPYMGYIGLSSFIRKGFFYDILVRNKVLILVILVKNWVWFYALNAVRSVFLEEVTFSIINDKTSY